MVKTSWQSIHEKKRMYNEVVRWHHQQVAYFLGNLKADRRKRVGICWKIRWSIYGSSIADGHEHEETNLPSAGGGAEVGSACSVSKAQRTCHDFICRS